jgi:hypothetical protein
MKRHLPNLQRLALNWGHGLCLVVVAGLLWWLV